MYNGSKMKKVCTLGVLVGIILCIYLIYTQSQLMTHFRAIEKNGKQIDDKAEDEFILADIEKVTDFADNVLDVTTLPTEQYNLYELFWKYMNTIQIVCSYQLRYGPRGDTGYEVCEDETYRPGKPCLLYSFGSLYMFGFEEDILKYHQCEVHTFDPSVPLAGHFIPEGVNFHLIGLGDSVTTNSKGWKMQTFSDFRRTLNHTHKTIDLLKIDIEGGEWVSLEHALHSGELRFVKQIQIELHFWSEQRVGMPMVKKLIVLKQLYQQGFRIFMHERFWTAECERKMRPPHPNITLCVILSFVNTKYRPY